MLKNILDSLILYFVSGNSNTWSLMNPVWLLVVSGVFHTLGLVSFYVILGLWTHLLKLFILNEIFLILFLGNVYNTICGPKPLCVAKFVVTKSRGSFSVISVTVSSTQSQGKDDHFLCYLPWLGGFSSRVLYSWGIAYLSPGFMQGGLILQLIWSTWRLRWPQHRQWWQLSLISGLLL